jgi:hypothetical protein
MSEQLDALTSPNKIAIRDAGFTAVAAATGYTRLDNHFCRASKPGRITVDIANIDFTTTAQTEINFLAGVVTLDGIIATDPSAQMFPATATALLLSFQLTVKSAGILNWVNNCSVHVLESTGEVFESAVFQVQEQAAMAAGLTLGLLTPQIKVPVYGGSKIKRTCTFAGTGSAVTAVRLLGYWD